MMSFKKTVKSSTGSRRGLSARGSKQTVARRGRPPDRSLGGRILDAVLAIVAEKGCAALTMDAVAHRAAVTKSSLYRYWPSKTALMIDAYLSVERRERNIDTGSLRKDLESALKQDFAAMKDPRFARLGTAILLESQANEEFVELMREKTIVELRQKRKEMLQRGVNRGEVNPAANLDIVLDMELGAIWYRAIIGFLPLDQSYPERLAAQLARGLRLPPKERS